MSGLDHRNGVRSQLDVDTYHRYITDISADGLPFAPPGLRPGGFYFRPVA